MRFNKRCKLLYYKIVSMILQSNPYNSNFKGMAVLFELRSFKILNFRGKSVTLTIIESIQGKIRFAELTLGSGAYRKLDWSVLPN